MQLKSHILLFLKKNSNNNISIEIQQCNIFFQLTNLVIAGMVATLFSLSDTFRQSAPSVSIATTGMWPHPTLCIPCMTPHKSPPPPTEATTTSGGQGSCCLVSTIKDSCPSLQVFMDHDKRRRWYKSYFSHAKRASLVYQFFL